MLRALAGLGVVHQPDFTEAMVNAIEREGGSIDTISPLSRSSTSTDTLERHGGALAIALFREPARSELEPELVHVARNGGRDLGRAVIRKMAEMRGAAL